MPLYEYQCQSCHTRFEEIRKFSDPPLETCPTCGGPVLKLVSSPAFQFKGTGFYITDYGRKPEGGNEKAGTDGGTNKGDRADKSDDSSPKDTSSRAEAGGRESTASSATKTDSPKTESVKTETAKNEKPSTKGD
jgi:putative FmdB family regulatory protein